MRAARVILGALLPLVLAVSGCGAGADQDATGTRRGDAAGRADPERDRGRAKPAKPARPSPDTGAGADGVDEDDVRDLIDKLEAPPELNGLIPGGDISWPQCPEGMGIPEKPTLGLPMPLPSARFVVMGLTNGPAFTPNPCLADQVRWVEQRNLMAAAYAVNSYPDDETLERHGSNGPYDGSTRLGALSNVGYQQAMFNVATMRDAALQTPIVWLDVEPVPIFEWSSDPTANSAVVRGAARGYTDAGYRIGVYSTQALWAAVVGDLRLGLPEWRAAGETSRDEALRKCAPDSSFQGGQAVLTQWVESNRDLDVTCPGTSADMLRWFHQY